MTIEDHLDSDEQEALAAVRKVVDPLWRPGNARDWRAPDASRRLTWSLGASPEGKPIITLVVDRDDSWAARQAKKLGEEFEGRVTWVSQGEAFAAYPEAKAARHATSRRIEPGVSIGHGRFRAGTLGCLVVVEDSELGDLVCVTTAAHVLALNDSVELGDVIYSPGKPDAGKALTRRDQIGRLMNHVALNPIAEYDPGEDIDTVYASLGN